MEDIITSISIKRIYLMIWFLLLFAAVQVGVVLGIMALIVDVRSLAKSIEYLELGLKEDIKSSVDSKS